MKNSTRRAFDRTFAVAIAAVCFGSLQPAQAGLFSISPDQERKMGGEAAKSIEAQSRVATGPVADWVERVGSRLTAVSTGEFTYSFRAIDGRDINAFALPGGHIYVLTGLRKVAQTDDELAAVLAHEITHAEAHHYARQYKKASKRGALLGVVSIFAGLPNLAQNVLGLIDFSMTQKYSRVHELEADHEGMMRMARAGFDPQGMVSLLEKLDRETDDAGGLDKWLADHPSAQARIRAARLQVEEIRRLQAQKDARVMPPVGAESVAPAVTTTANQR